MEPVLTNVTLDHEACHIIWQATQAVHWHRCHTERERLCVCVRVCEQAINSYWCEDVNI